MDVMAAAQERAGRSQGLVTRRQLLEAGVSEGGLLRAVADGRLVRVRRSVYAAAPLPAVPLHVVRDDRVAPEYAAHVRAALLSEPTAVATGRTAAALRGWGLLVEPRGTVELVVPHGRSHGGGPGLRVERRRQLVRDRYVAVPGTTALRVTPAAQTVADVAAARPLLEAVVVCDSALRSGHVDRAQLERVAARARGRRAARLTAVLDLADEQAGSVLESVQRVRMVLAGLTGFTTQVVVRAVPPLRVDFCFAGARLVVEVDGSRWHQDAARDRARDNALAALGFRVLRYTWADVVHDHERVLAEIAAALADGGACTRSVPLGCGSAA